MYATAEKIFNLSSKAQGCGTPIIRENFERRDTGIGGTNSTYQRLSTGNSWYYDKQPPMPTVAPTSAPRPTSTPNPIARYINDVIGGDKTTVPPSAPSSDHSISPGVWGPLQWGALHYSAAGYEDAPNRYTQMMMKQRIQTLPVEIPCASCRAHCAEYINKANIDSAVSSRTSLFQFYFDFHNAVNKRLGKPELDIVRAKEMYSF